MQKEKEPTDKSARDAATASSSTSAPGMEEEAMKEQDAGAFAGIPPAGDTTRL